MKTTKIRLDTNFQIGEVDPRIFGGFLEHIGRAVYKGVYDPDNALSDEDGFRTDILTELKKLDMTVVRYPGGNFASGYNWMDGIGPKDMRPVVRELAWQSIEPNTFGTDEFIQLCKKMNWTPMITVNLGTGAPEDARNWVEYTNCPTGTKFADMRQEYGNKDPFNVKLWCLGNEMDGPWQMGHVPAKEYAIRAQQAARMMKYVDKSIETVVAGSCTPSLPTYIDWDITVLEHLGELADYISLHRYVGNHENDTTEYLAVTNAIDQQIEEIDAICRMVQAKSKSNKRTYLCFDEWNVWYKNHITDGEGKFAPNLIEEIYNLEDSLVVAGFLNSFIRHADVVKIANIAQIVNTIAPIITNEQGFLIQSTFFPFQMISQNGKGTALKIVIDGPGYDSQSYGYVNYIDVSAVWNKDKLNIFLINRCLTDNLKLSIELGDRVIKKILNCEILSGKNPKDANSFENTNILQIKKFNGVSIIDHKVNLRMPVLSFISLCVEL
tara:strand:- start:31655 stop:33139 length:1485 start_codon:yes stop_codon:yes gene_type:complete